MMSKKMMGYAACSLTSEFRLNIAVPGRLQSEVARMLKRLFVVADAQIIKP